MGNNQAKPTDYVKIHVEKSSIKLFSKTMKYGKPKYTMKFNVNLSTQNHDFMGGRLIVRDEFFKRKAVRLRKKIVQCDDHLVVEIVLESTKHISKLKQYPFLELHVLETAENIKAGHTKYKHSVQPFFSMFKEEFQARHPGKNLTMIDIWGGRGGTHSFNYNGLDRILSGETKIGYDLLYGMNRKCKYIEENNDASMLHHVHAVIFVLTPTEFEDDTIKARFLKWIQMVSRHGINPLVLIGKADTQETMLRKNPLQESKAIEELKNNYRRDLRTKYVNFALPYITEKLRNFEIDCHNFLLIRDIYNLASDYYDTHENLMVDGSKKGLSKRSLNIAIIGPPGAGKSTTLQTFLTIFQDVEEVQYGRVTCAGAGHTTTRLHGYALVTREKDGTSVQEEN
mmetsp:Transcript_6248/g.8706  ORF Transcript_6248/g.8706 Transcript_6248/m.8706 type:complete len:397 (+) Transcript_6248:302-1492(+)